MNYWLRLYTNTLDNRKAQRLTGEDFKGWVNILCLAKEHDGLLPSVEDIAFRLRITEADAERLVEELVKRELLDRTEDGITPHDWDEWQCLRDPAADKKQFRDNKAGDNTQGRGVSYVYFIGTTIDRIVKIGISKNPWARVTECQIGSPEILTVLAAFRGSAFSEWDIHQLLDAYRQHGEWFLLPENIQQIVMTTAAGKQNYDELATLLRSELRSNSTTDNYATTTEKSREETETEKSREEAARVKPRSPKRPTTCDSEFLAELQASPAYTVFDVAAIYYRMVEWCRIRGKQPTRARLVNWLNREDRPMTANGKPPKNTAAYVGKNKPTVEEPMAEEMDEYVDTAILANDLVYLAKLRDEILKRSAVHDWERKVLAYFEQPIPGNEPVTPAEMADLNKRIAALQPITRVG